MDKRCADWPEGSEVYIRWTIGTEIVFSQGEKDCGVMSWDPDEFEVERNTGPNAVGYIVSRDFHENQGWSHGVFFPNSEVWVNIYGEELESDLYEIREVGNGYKPRFETPNAFRDPEVLRQIHEKRQITGE